VTRTRSTDVRILACEIEFRPIQFRRPLHLSSGPIHGATEARAVAKVFNRAGSRGTGCGSVLLSHPWAYDPPRADPEADDRAMREMVLELATIASSDRGYTDPFEHADRLTATVVDMPRLPALVCLAPIDAAVHDAWARAAGTDAYRLYGCDFVARDLGSVFGRSMRGRHVGDYLRSRPLRRMPVSHVVGIADSLVDLRNRVAREGVWWLKVKVSGADPTAAARRVTEVVVTARAALRGAGVTAGDVRVSLDPNESFSHASPVVELLDRLAADDPSVRSAVTYLEQPFPRHVQMPRPDMRIVSRRVPLLLDEGLDEIARLPELVAQGWSGLTVKTARTQTQALRAAAFAVHHQLPLALQDLTNIGEGVLQSARLVSVLPMSFPALEFNSRDVAPQANDQMARLRPELFAVHNGCVSLGERGTNGLY
jgi:L-alanine-DL-glutamate epimerase-like enolase superfamily enzyme